MANEIFSGAIEAVNGTVEKVKTALNTNKPNITNPPTGDNILLFVWILLISVSGIVAVTIIKFKKNSKNKI